MKCDICGCREFAQAFIQPESGNAAHAFVCMRCELTTLNWAEGVDPTDHYDYYMQRRGEWWPDSDQFLVMVDRQRFWLNRNLPVGEVGAGPGALASAILRLGYEYIGCEPGKICKEAREHFFLSERQLRQQDFREYFLQLGDEKQQLGTIFMWHVLEHVHSPAALFRMAHSALCPGGKLLIQIPRQIEKWLYPQHRSFFTATTMQALATKHDSKVRLSTPDEERGFDLYVIEKAE